MIKTKHYKTKRDVDTSIRKLSQQGYTCKQIDTRSRRFFHNDSKATSYINTKSKKVLTYVYL